MPKLPTTAALFTLMLVSEPLAAKSRMLPLPKEVISASPFPEWFQNKLFEFRSEPLWSEVAVKEYPERYRMTYFGILIDSLQIQIDQRKNGAAMLVARIHRKGRLIEETSVQLSQRDYNEFKSVADGSGLWTKYPEFWVLSDNEEICVDGMEALMERRDDRGYRFSNGNTSCTSPPGMGRLAEKMIALADLKTPTRWLPWQQ